MSTKNPTRIAPIPNPFPSTNHLSYSTVCDIIIIIIIPLKNFFDHLFYFFKTKINASQYWFGKCCSTSSNLVTYFIALMQSVSTQGQVDAVYFDLTNAFDIFIHFSLTSFSNFGLYASYVNWLCSYLPCRQASVRFSGVSSSHSYIMKSGVPQGSILGPILFNAFINDICNSIRNYSCLLFAENLKVLRNIRNAVDCKLLQSDVDCVQKRCCYGQWYETQCSPNYVYIIYSYSKQYSLYTQIGFNHIAHSQSLKVLG